MTKTHPAKKIIFCPINIETSYDENQGMHFVYLETKPFDYEGIFPVKNPETGKLEGKNQTRQFSHLRLTFNSHWKIKHFSLLVKKGQFYEIETSWSSAGPSANQIGGEWVERVNINETKPQIKKILAGKETKTTENPTIVWVLGIGGGILILGIILGLFRWQKGKKKLNKQK